MSYRVEHKTSRNGKWSVGKFDSRRTFVTADLAWSHAASFDEDGYCHPATIRVVHVESGAVCDHRPWPNAVRA